MLRLPRLLLLLAALPAVCSAETLKRVSVEDIVQRLHKEGIPICFERVLNVKADALSLKRQIELIEAIPEGDRTESERKTLDNDKSALKAGRKEDEIVNWRMKQFDFEFPKSPLKVKTVLNAAVKADPAYRWSEIDGKYVVYPKELSSNQPLAKFSAMDLVFPEFMQQMYEQVGKPAKLNYFQDITGRPWWDDIKDHTFSLTLKNTDTRTALTTIANRLAPNVIWTIRGEESERFLEFGVVGF